MNNKGFAVSGILYTILLIFLALLMMLLFNFEGKKNILDNIKSELYNDVNDAKYVKYENGTAIYFNPETGSVCSSTNAVSNTGTKTGCMKWYIFNDSTDNENVNMILDHNTTALSRWSNSSNNTNGDAIEAQLNNDTASWKNNLIPRLIGVNEIAKIINYNDFNEKETSDWFYLDSANQTQVANSTTKSTYSWLYNYTKECISSGCNVEDSTTYGYWTSTKYPNDTNILVVNRGGSINSIIANNSTFYGVRPVITVSKEVLEGEVCDANLNQVYTFDYTNGEQEFDVPCSGNYKLETWGASSNLGSTYAKMGYGGYSNGNIIMEKNTKLFVNVGGQGVRTTATTSLGGYNGGGMAKDYSDGRGAGSGGGATHISLKSGLLSSLSDTKSDILIVSGGAGGVGNFMGLYTVTLTSGSGGGYLGSNGTSPNSTYGTFIGYGGTQTQAGTSNSEQIYDKLIYIGSNGSFGAGGTCATSKQGNCSGGGGGYYGGGFNTNYSGAGGGGSGYIDNPLLTNKAMYCYNCTESNDVDTKTISTTNVSSTPTSNYAKQGNGYAKITYLGN